MEVEEMMTMFCRSVSKFRTRSIFIYLFGALLIPALAASARAADPWTPSEIIQPKDLARQLAASQGHRVILQVGFSRLYKQAHIPGAQYCGPASKPEGLARLKDCAEKIAKSREIIIYCGCCPWKDCPNIRPAFEALRRMGFTNLKVLDIPQDFGQDWVKKGFPVEPSR
jgi:thiosulfate/3-mercaptopyruvate sulfurtransferase